MADILLNQILASNNGACSGMSRDEGLCSTFGLVDYITTNIINSAHQDFEANYFTSIFNAYGNPCAMRTIFKMHLPLLSKHYRTALIAGKPLVTTAN
ncbi:MAG: hypothetical protein R2798_12985 [Chitinophagales bacterium]